MTQTSLSRHQVAEYVSYVQHGDYDLVKEGLRKRILSPNALDESGCSLLHWAAINNRFGIANLLIDNGANIAVTGGILEENPLQWAIRKRFYSMVDLLLRKGDSKLQLSHRSKQGHDALGLALGLDDKVMFLLLLHFGADPNAVNDDGNTLLLHLIKQEPSYLSTEFVNLLLHFDADTTKQDAEGNTVLHILAQEGKANLFMLFAIYQKCGEFGMMVENQEGYTPISIAKEMATKHKLKKPYMFFQAAQRYSTLPYHAPTMAAAFTVCLMMYSVYYFGALFGMLAWFCFQNFAFPHLDQWMIAQHRGRVSLGFGAGVLLASIATYVAYVKPFISTFTHLVALASVIGCMYCLYKFNSTKPQNIAQMSYADGESRKKLISNILSSCPKEGTYEEHVDALQRQEEVHATKAQSSKMKSTHVSSAALGMTLMPLRVVKLCTVCLVDRPKNVSHCKYCGYCIQNRSQHVDFFNNCVGKGNSRIYLLLLLTSMMSTMLFVVTSTWVFHSHMCADREGMLWNFFAVQGCVWYNHPAMAMCYLINIALFIAILSWENTHVAMVLQETTYVALQKGGHPPFTQLTPTEACNRLWALMRYGTHSVDQHRGSRLNKSKAKGKGGRGAKSSRGKRQPTSILDEEAADLLGDDSEDADEDVAVADKDPLDDYDYREDRDVCGWEDEDDIRRRVQQEQAKKGCCNKHHGAQAGAHAHGEGSAGQDAGTEAITMTMDRA